MVLLTYVIAIIGKWVSMRYKPESAVESAPQSSQDKKRDFWLFILIMTGLVYVGSILVGIVMMSSVTRCIMEYRGAGRECIVLFNHFAYQTWQGVLLNVVMVASFIAFVAVLVMYLKIRR